ncbi:alpha-L-fucosidase [Paenibacillus sp. HB172176]|uniref:alpha-L-fucosidase n=1 Tax=Paenibacillus sp. HB172176 TaxID=2493690 RepID=UPI0014388D78|nr:alpha-L-fucosidase [Paenibacillus sp. HB172176]
MSKEGIAKPTADQLAWQDLELGMFCHFGMNTFTGKEWGDGGESPQAFAPSQFDARQWVRVAKRAGFRYLILTAKHHDGFCLWPTKTTDHSVASSSWRNGKGDVVGEVAEACREEGILFGLYLSPWDRHEPKYADKAAYDDLYAEQLTELLTSYGPLVEVWFDGAGSEGREYDWRRIIGLVEKYQPHAMRFNMGVPTIRWVGNEDGIAPYPCWNRAESARASMFTPDMLTWLPETPLWVPAECDVPIRPKSWFWREGEESIIFSREELLHIYYSSVGHGCNLLMNLAPDNRGLIPDADADAAIGFLDEVRRRFAKPLATVSGEGQLHEIQFAKETAVDHIVLMERIEHGELVRSYTLEAVLEDGSLSMLVEGSAIGHKKIDRFPAVKAAALRLRITDCVGNPDLREMSAYFAGIDNN